MLNEQLRKTNQIAPWTWDINKKFRRIKYKWLINNRIKMPIHASNQRRINYNMT